MKNLAFSLVSAIFLLVLNFPVIADDYKPDDMVIFDLAAEDWVTTKTARVVVNVMSSVSSATAGNTRTAIAKALDDLAKADWRLISFNRFQDQTGMEQWNISYEARLPENMLSGLNENAKKLSKPGMQISISTIDFSPTLEETQAVMAQLRSKIYKMANEQLGALNSAFPNRNYRISMINFTPDSAEEIAFAKPRAIMAKGKLMTMEAAVAEDSSAISSPVERSEKIIMKARVIMAALAPVESSKSQSVQKTQ